MKTIKLFILFTILILNSSMAIVINVPADQPTIQAGLNGASSGDTVLVASGTYFENIIWPETNGIKLIGENRETTIIDGDSSGSVIRLVFDTENTIIDNTTLITEFTIQNGCACEDETILGSGGGILCFNVAPLIENLIIQNNSAFVGGGIGIYYGLSPILLQMSNLIIKNNNAEIGGGMYFYPEGQYYTNRNNLTNILITNNRSESYGGGISMHYEYLNFLNCIIWNNLPDDTHQGMFGSYYLFYSDIQNGWEGEGNISSDPLFTDPNNGDFTLQSNSPCINAGTSFFVFEGDTLVNMSEDEYVGVAPDMGVFEFEYIVEYDSPVWHIATDGSDETGDGSAENPYATIQSGIDLAVDGDTVLVASGTYVENISFNGKNIVVTSVEGADNTIIDGNQNGSVVTFVSEEDSLAVLDGFTVQNGVGKYYSSSPWPGPPPMMIGGGIIIDDASPTLLNLVISGNTTYSPNDFYGLGGGIGLIDSESYLDNIIITNNSAEGSGGGIYLDSSTPSFSNISVFNNSADNYGGVYLTRGFGSLDESDINFSQENRSSIYSNIGNSQGIDIYSSCSDCMVNVVLDTFTVMNPTAYYASPINNYTFDIQNAINGQINANLYVSPDGDNSNDGLTANTPLQTLGYAIQVIYADSLSPKTIHLENGVYSPSSNGEDYPISLIDFVSIIGESQVGVVLDAEESSRVIKSFNINNSILKNVTITGGYSSKGAGIYCSNSNNEFENIIIENNTSTEAGGGMYCSASNIFLKSIKIINNSASECGGGIYSFSSAMKLLDVIMSDNFSDLGGAVGTVFSSSIDFINTTIVNNDAEENAGGIYCAYNSNFNFVNSIVWNNSLEEIYFAENYTDPVLIFTHTNLNGGEDGIITNGNGTIYWEEGNISSDPLFTDPNNGDFTLQSNSPCINAGTSFFVFEGDTLVNMTDDEYFGVAPDMGAFEYEGEMSNTEEAGQFLTDFQLFECYPNPFNPSTTISFQLPQQETFNISVYNVKGELVEVLLNKKINTGFHQFDWKPNNNIPSGSYFVKISSLNFEKINKIIYLK